MPLSDDFLLTQLTIDFVDGPRSSTARLRVDPDDVRGRGLLVTFLNVERPVDMTDASVLLYWQHDQAPALRGLEPFEAVDAAAGRWKVHYPADMGKSGGTVSAKIMVSEGGHSPAIPLPPIYVNDLPADPSATPSGDDFSVLGTLLAAMREGVGDVTAFLEEARPAVEGANEAAQAARDAASEVGAATRRANAAAVAAEDAGDATEGAIARADAATSRATGAATDASDAAKAAEAAASRAETSAGAADTATRRAEEAAEGAESSAKSAQTAAGRADASADAADEAAERAGRAAGRADTAADAAEEAAGTAASAADVADRAAADVERDAADGAFDGATFTPSVDELGNLSWTNDKGRDNPPTVNVRGPSGFGGDVGGARFFVEVDEGGDLWLITDDEAAQLEMDDNGDLYQVLEVE